MSIMGSEAGLPRFSLLFLLLLLFAGGCASSLSGGVPIRVSYQNKIREIPIERYVEGVLEKEVGKDWPIEALKAQAVASRTYALYRKNHPRNERYDIESDVSDQVFELKRRYSPSIAEAVGATEGEALTVNGEILLAFFHSSCGGTSERADRVWEDVTMEPLLKIHEDPFCSDSPRHHWDYSLSREELSQLLAGEGTRLEDDWELQVKERDESGRASKITFQSSGSDQEIISLSANHFRGLLGAGKLRSTLFEITDGGDPIVFEGHGSGHGVGLCQWGAKGMAEQGKTYREILEFYYPGAELTPPKKELPPDPE